jgi:hypothetical protein
MHIETIYFITMSKSFSVPIIVQSKSKNCWHAGASMIWAYWQGVTGRQGPMNTEAAEWEDNKGISDCIALGEKTGLVPIIHRPWYYSTKSIELLLRNYGPLWCAGYWYGLPHIIVLTGVDEDFIFLNDPGDGIRKTETVSWFNMHLANHIDGCLLYKDPSAY